MLWLRKKYFIKYNSNLDVQLKETIWICIPKSFHWTLLSSRAGDQETIYIKQYQMEWDRTTNSWGLPGESNSEKYSFS